MRAALLREPGPCIWPGLLRETDLPIEQAMREVG